MGHMGHMVKRPSSYARTWRGEERHLSVQQARQVLSLQILVWQVGAVRGTGSKPGFDTSAQAAKACQTTTHSLSNPHHTW